MSLKRMVLPEKNTLRVAYAGLTEHTDGEVFVATRAPVAAPKSSVVDRKIADGITTIPTGCQYRPHILTNIGSKIIVAGIPRFHNAAVVTRLRALRGSEEGR